MDIETLYGKPVRVYWNFHRKIYSVQLKVDGRWKVAAHLSYFSIRNPIYRVSQAGRARVLREGRKNVHAYIYGELLRWSESDVLDIAMASTFEERVSYNPREADTFVACPHYKRLPMVGAYSGVLRCDVREDRPSMWHYGTDYCVPFLVSNRT